jgi:hypothetical protein
METGVGMKRLYLAIAFMLSAVVFSGYDLPAQETDFSGINLGGDQSLFKNRSPLSCAQERCNYRLLKECVQMPLCEPLIKQSSLYSDAEIKELRADIDTERIIDAGIIGAITGGILAVIIGAFKIWKNRHRFKPSKASKGLISLTVIWFLGVSAFQFVAGDFFYFWNRFYEPEHFGLMLFPPAIVIIAVRLWMWSNRN